MPRSISPLLGAALLASCAGLPVARMELPAPLAAQPPQALQGLGFGRSGEFALAAERGRFERGADRLTVFDALSFDRVAVRYTSTGTSASCRGRQTEGSLGILAGQPRPFEFQCRYDGAFAGQLTLQGRAGAAGTQQQRNGRLSAGGIVLDIASVHRVQGSPLPLAFAAGYVLTHEGRAIAAVELTDARPRVWLPEAPPALAAAATHAAITLALLWDPSQRGE